MEAEIVKIKIYVPLTKLLKHFEDHFKVATMLNPLGEVSSMSDSLNIQDDSPTFLFGPRVEEYVDEDTPPFYINLNIHNSMYDLGDSHNTIPRVFMEELGLEVTKPYKDIFSFDSNKFRCLGLIKDLVVSWSQIPTKKLVRM